MERVDPTFEDEATTVEPLFVLGSEPPKSTAPFRVMPMPVPARVVTYQEHELLESAAFKERVESIAGEMMKRAASPPAPPTSSSSSWIWTRYLPDSLGAICLFLVLLGAAAVIIGGAP